ncbi:MAG: hypothetical protein HQM14_11335 [SAR324 cluster bacterium]|nr:hypothetical protein [SAR324 cluster bacterium]
MFGFKKKVQYSSSYEHSTQRNDWENVLDELFIEVIHSARCGVAIISNTTKTRSDDVVGESFGKLNFRIRNDLPDSLSEKIRSLGPKQFSKIFAAQDKLKPVIFDCYKIKNLGLPNNTLVYFIEKNNKRALLVFAPPILQRELVRLVQKISDVLKRNEKIVKRTSIAPPRYIPVHQYATTNIKQLKDRLNYLDGREHLNPREVLEIQDLEKFIITNMTEHF